METYQQRIDQVEARRDTLLKRCLELQSNLGEAALELSEDALGSSHELVKQYYQHQDEIQSISSTVEKILQKQDRQQQIKDEIGQLKSTIKEHHNDLDPLYEKLGAIAFRLFREHPLIDTSYSGAFQKLAEVHDDLRQVDLQLQQLNATSENKKLVNKVVSHGKDMILRNRRNSLEAKLPKLYINTAQQLMDTDFPDQVDDPELGDAVSALKSVFEAIQRDEQRIQTLEKETAQLETEIQQLTENNRVPRFRQQSDDQIEQHRQDMYQILVALGEALEENPPDQLAAKTEPLQECRENVAQTDTLLRRLRAGQQAQEIDRSTEKLTKKKNSLEEEIQKLTKQVQDIDQQMEELASQRKQLVKTRGEEAELFSE